MKIVYCIAGMYRPAGMERVLSYKANWLARHGHSVSIITTEQKGRPSAFPLDAGIRIHDLGIGYEDNNGASVLGKLISYPLKQRKHKKLLRNKLRELSPDVTISLFDHEANILPGIKEGGKKVLEVHFSRRKRLQYGRKGLWKIIDSLRFRADGKTAARYDRFVVLTERDKASWKEVANIEVIPNPLGFAIPSQAPLEEKNVLAVGRLCHQKGFDRLLEAWRMIGPEKDGWTLSIAGDGEEREKLEASAPEGVQFLGNVKDMESLYRHSSIVALSSRYEGLPMVLIEAQSFGIPCVAFDCDCGPSEIISDGRSGLIVKEGDIEGLAGGLSALMNNDGLRKIMGEEAFRLSGRWSLDSIMEKWQTLLKSI